MGSGIEVVFARGTNNTENFIVFERPCLPIAKHHKAKSIAAGHRIGSHQSPVPCATTRSS
jgi:hypothetical protein